MNEVAAVTADTVPKKEKHFLCISQSVVAGNHKSRPELLRQCEHS